MILSFKKRFVFIHIPKCAGESITELLLDPRNGGAQFMMKHSTYADAERVLGNDIDSFTVFAIIRNPFEQVVSFYEHLRKPLYMDSREIEKQYPGSNGKLTPLWASDLAIRLEFNDYVQEVYGCTEGPRRMMQDCCYWLKTISGDVNGCITLRYENLGHEFKILAEEMGLEGELPRKNISRYGMHATSSTDYRRYYNEISRATIENSHAHCLREFNYGF